MSLDEFLAWEERQDLRWEYDGLAPMAMTGGTAEHSAIQRNIYIAVGAHGCEANHARFTPLTSRSGSRGRYDIRMLSWYALVFLEGPLW
jgi:hypothetical protein